MISDRLKEEWVWFYFRKIRWPFFRLLQKLNIWQPSVIGYMCKVDFECELGAAVGGNTVYPSIEDLKRNRGCYSECGVVEVVVRLKRVVQQEDYSRMLDIDSETGEIRAINGDA